MANVQHWPKCGQQHWDLILRVSLSPAVCITLSKCKLEERKLQRDDTKGPKSPISIHVVKWNRQVKGKGALCTKCLQIRNLEGKKNSENLYIQATAFPFRNSLFLHTSKGLPLQLVQNPLDPLHGLFAGLPDPFLAIGLHRVQLQKLFGEQLLQAPVAFVRLSAHKLVHVLLQQLYPRQNQLDAG